LSGVYPALLRKRSELMLRLAAELLDRGAYDVAALLAEYAAQLRIKSLLYRVTGEEWRGHSIRSLLGALALSLRNEDFHEEAEMIEDYVRANRRLLAELEEAHTRAVYSVLEYTREQAEIILRVAEDVTGLVSRVEERVLGGHEAKNNP